MVCDLTCQCGNKLAKSQNGEVKLRVKLVKWNHDGMFAVCKSCSSDVPVDAAFLKGLGSAFSYEVDADPVGSIVST